MRQRFHIGFVCLFSLFSLAGNACRPNDDPQDTGDGQDAATTGMPQDLGKSEKTTTIRERNTPGGPVKLKDRVTFSGVVTSPLLWTDNRDNPMGNDFCNFRIAVMQADGSPSTLADGMVVTISLRTMFMGDMSQIASCRELRDGNAVAKAMDGLKLNEQVEVQGILDSFGTGGTRFVDVFGGKVTSKGMAAMKPVPVKVADPAMFTGGTPVPKAFVDACGVLVEFNGVKVTSRDAMYQDFTVNTTDMGGAKIATNYLKIVENMYESPAKDTQLKSLVGIVFGDFKGTIWPRTGADVVKQ